VNLRERGVYLLPNGRELVVFKRGEKVGVLFTLERSGQVEYEVNQAGRLLSEGKLTAWDISDLKDTGRTTQQFPRPSESKV
jgi:hypothetical protein